MLLFLFLALLLLERFDAILTFAFVFAAFEVKIVHAGCGRSRRGLRLVLVLVSNSLPATKTLAGAEDIAVLKRAMRMRNVELMSFIFIWMMYRSNSNSNSKQGRPPLILCGDLTLVGLCRARGVGLIRNWRFNSCAYLRWNCPISGFS